MPLFLTSPSSAFIIVSGVRAMARQWRVAVDDWRIIFEKDSQDKFRIHDVVDRKYAYRSL
jgi:hypothetical protein